MFSRLILLLTAFLLLPAGAATLTEAAQQRFSDGCAAYEAGKFTNARQLFADILGQDKLVSADLFYNLGCAEARLSNAGPAALWFHRAVLLEPRHHEAWQNLRFLNRKEGALVVADSGFDAFLRFAKTSHWQRGFLICSWLVAVSAAALVFLRPRVVWPFVVTLCLSVVLAGFLGTAWWVRTHQVPPQEIAVVMSGNLSALNAPAEGADSLISLPPGSEVRILQVRGQWSYVEVAGAKATRGWVRSEHLESLWPWSLAAVL
ncbi:MAG: SH3 domain-containing protein [Verrucomicrobiales bacterium]|nr:SH3 domain-containing protein [Verrucomicrobiales bacterium]